MPTRVEIQKVFARVCQDSGFTIQWVPAAVLTARVMEINPLQVWNAFPSVDAMQNIARGNIPIWA